MRQECCGKLQLRATTLVGQALPCPQGATTGCTESVILKSLGPHREELVLQMLQSYSYQRSMR